MVILRRWTTVAIIMSLFLAMGTILMPAQPAQAESKTSPFISDNVTKPEGFGINGCSPGGIAINNGIINIDHFGETSTFSPWCWLYPGIYTNLFLEEPFLAYGANLPTQAGLWGIPTQCYPATGNPDQWYEAVYDIDLNGDLLKDITVHRSIMVPSGQKYFLVRYIFQNVSGGSLDNFRLFEYVDYDVAILFTDDAGGYSTPDFAWVRDLSNVGTYVGFKANKDSAHHDVDYLGNVAGRVSLGALSDLNNFPGPGDCAVAMEWGFGNLPPGGSATLEIRFAFADSLDALQGILVPNNTLPREQAEGASSGEAHSTTLRTANLNIKNVTANPSVAQVNQPVTIATQVFNDGGEAGSRTVALNINGRVEQTQTVTVGPGSSRKVEFTVTKAQPGTYTASIGGVRGNFAVIAGDRVDTSAPVDSGVVAILLVGALVLISGIALAFAFRRPA